jgi:hypothetical protein
MKRQRGFVIAWLVMLIPAMLVFLGLVLDFGMVFLRSQELDAATDAAALAATDAWDRDYWKWEGKVRIDPSEAASKARVYLARNMPHAKLVQVTVGPPNRVTVRAEVNTPYFFLRILGWHTTTVESFSTAVRRSVR